MILWVRLRAVTAAALLVVGAVMISLARFVNPTDVLDPVVEDLFVSLEIADARLDARIREMEARP